MNDQHLPALSKDRDLQVEPDAVSPLVLRGIERLKSISQSQSKALERIEDRGEPVLRWSFVGLLHQAGFLQVAHDSEHILVGDTHDTLRVLDARTGAERWHYRCEGEWITLPGPIHGTNTVILAGTGKTFRAFEALSGHIRWSFDGNVDWSAIVDNSVIVATHEGHVRALDLQDGHVLWGTGFESRWNSQRGIALHNKLLGMAEGSIFGEIMSLPDDICFEDHRLRVQDAKSGQRLWFTALECHAWRTPILLMVDGSVFVSVSRGSVSALDAYTGIEQWRFKPRDEQFLEPVTVVDGAIMIWAETAFYAVDVGTGVLRWRYSPESDLLHVVAAARDTVYIIDESGQLHAVDTMTGVPRWKHSDKGQRQDDDSPTIAVADGIVYIGSRRFIELFESDEEDDDSGNTLQAMDANTGRLLWTVAGIGPVSSLLVTKDLLVVMTEEALLAFEHRSRPVTPSRLSSTAGDCALLDLRPWDDHPHIQKGLRDISSAAKFGGPMVLLCSHDG